MSGIYIPDASLPQDGDFELWIAVKKDGTFSYNVRGRWQNGNRVANPVPDHGRLIDADALLESIKEAKKKQPEISDVYDEDYFAVAAWVRYAPTIIPAEEDER